MLEKGLWVQGADGKIAEHPSLAAYRAFQEQQAKAAAAPAPAPAAAAPTARQARIAELEKKYDDPNVNLTAAEMREYQRLVAQDEIDQRDAAREAAQQEIIKRHEQQSAAERAQAQAAEATRAQQAKNAAEAEAEINKTLKTLEDQLRDPVSGKVEPTDVDVAKRYMIAVLLETQDWDKARTAVREHAARQAARFKSIVAAMPKQATAPAPAPVSRGGQPVSGGSDKGEAFDPENPFPDGGLSRYAKAAR